MRNITSQMTSVTSQTHFYEPAKGHRLPHSPFQAIVSPRPIGWISTVDLEGRVNLAPFSFFNAMSVDPPIVGFCTLKRGDTLKNVEKTQEFVANVATFDLSTQVNMTSAEVEHGVDEMKLAGLEAAPSVMVKPPRVAASPAALECKLLTITQLRDLDGRQLNVFQIVGQVVGVHIVMDYLRDGMFDTSMARNLARCGYRNLYTSTDKLFEIARPSGSN